jgi:hypothetical protein
MRSLTSFYASVLLNTLELIIIIQVVKTNTLNYGFHRQKNAFHPLF